MPIVLTAEEIEGITKSPEVLRVAAEWREFQQDRADSVEAGTVGDGERALALRAEADRIESEY